MKSINDNTEINYRRPQLEDGLKIHQLIADSPPLDVNSSYLYFLQSSHFADTCVVAEKNGEIVGFISGYIRPDKADELFVWQMVVAEAGRGHGIAKGLVRKLLKQSMAFNKQPLQTLSCTIGPSNQASQGVFKSLAKAFGLNIRSEAFLTEAHFAGQEHEAEDYYFLTAPDGQSLNDYLNNI